MSQVTYNVDIEKLPAFLTKLFDKVPLQVYDEAAGHIKYTTELTMRNQSPSSFKSGRGYRGPTLRDSIKTHNVTYTEDEISFYTGPTKKVDGHDLGVMMEKGSNNPVDIFPKKGTYLKFIDKAGNRRFEKHVTRGIIPPNPFVKRIAEIMKKKAPEILLTVFKKHLGSIRV